ncbi:MAG: hypothetical protein EZS28_010810 [Streblomastix strix]|uniref:Uncharacterized protein n=1 Tax=Streblomastix strix TaxID=222440 RepID=A0A5J4WFA6_9EUKA|nr:MAG: hypothetical protein EZS28_010810 [Streblomastix strix]
MRDCGGGGKGDYKDQILDIVFGGEYLLICLLDGDDAYYEDYYGQVFVGDVQSECLWEGEYDVGDRDDNGEYEDGRICEDGDEQEEERGECLLLGEGYDYNNDFTADGIIYAGE